MAVKFEYIDKNLMKVLENPDSIMYIRPYDKKNKKALFVVIKEEEGVYKKVQITKEQSKMTFPYEPIYYFYNGPGYILLKNYIVFDNQIALNTTNLDGFTYKIYDNDCYTNKKKPLIDKIANINIFATFNDGSATWIKREFSKYFEKKGGIETYINLLKQYKSFEPKHDNYKYIELFSDSNDTFIITELQNFTKEQQQNEKRLLIKKEIEKIGVKQD